MNLINSFIKFCEHKEYEINENQISIVKKLSEFYNLSIKQSFIKKIFAEKNNKLGFYLVGDVGVGKTMILNFFFNFLKEKKKKITFQRVYDQIS